MAKKNALGRGLGALIEDNSSEVQQEVVNNAHADATSNISLKLIETNPFQPRTKFNEDALNELAESIRELGVIQPITVRKIDSEKFQLITGERRFRASQIAGLDSIPAYVRDADDQNMLEMALVENIQREDLDAMEIAISYQRLIEECSLTQENLSQRVGKNRTTISNYLRLLKLPAQIQLGIRNGLLSMGHARAIITIDDSHKQLEVFNQIINEELSVRKTEELVRKIEIPSLEVPKKETGSKQPDTKQEYQDLQKHLSGFFKASIEFKRTDKGSGKIIIPFKSDEDLERIIAILDK